MESGKTVDSPSLTIKTLRVRKIFWTYSTLPFVFLILTSALSCRKSSKAPEPDSPSQPIDTLTQNIYTIDTTASPSVGIILTAPFDSSINTTSPGVTGLLLIMNQSGKVLQKLTTPGLAYNLERWIINGNTRYTYAINDPSALRPPMNLENAGYYIVADSNLNTLQKITLTPFQTGLFQPGQALDIHDIVLISDSDYITLTYNWEYVTNIPARLSPAVNGSVISAVIEEVKNGSVTWHWDSSNDTTFYGTSVEGNNFADPVIAADYVHMNSMYVDPRDNNLICSMRNQDQIIKINRTTGAIMWRLGGVNSDFQLSPDQTFLRQHHATLTDNNQTLLMFDNGQVSIRPYSRICEFQLDETNKVITSFKFFNIPEPFNDYTGSVQKIGSDYFIGGGMAHYMLDINYNTGQKVAEYEGTMASYRSLKY